MPERRDGAPLTNPRSERVRRVAALSRRSARERSGLFLAEGPQGVREAVRHRPDAVAELYVESTAARHERWTPILADARAAGLPVTEVDERVLATISDTATPQGGLAVCRRLDVPLAEVLDAGPRLLCVLAHVRDPGNAGTVLRGADATGADAVLVTGASVDLYSPKVVRSTAGSLFHVPVVLGLDVLPLLARLAAAGITTYAADGTGATLLPEADLRVPHAWVFGNEAWGLPAPTREACDEVVAIPTPGRAESLNLAMAATVCLYASATAARDRSPAPSAGARR
ncbi:MAG: RNA methyltransferase [Austwickia sp.]|nr:RNA methyltransferase [Actinomycetota bacterium]MCB1252483.1 RNA methyltransferase [Austwickia sp.]MCO5308699.1 RNA methyltransferase [Austwickia sp.]